MGITGLLPMVKNCIKSKHIRNYAGKVIGIDGHAWIHTVLPHIAEHIYTGKPTDRHLKILKNKIQNLLDYDITPIFIFDGDFLPSKEKTFLERRAAREKAKKEVEMYVKQKNFEKARELMKRAVSITSQLFDSITKFLQGMKIEYIISPYEADAQLYYLQKINYIDHILTEDSDLILYRAKKILYKFSGSHVEEFDLDLLPRAKDDFFSKNILDICILSGCDYLNSIKGVGLITAHKYLKEVSSVESFINKMRNMNKDVPDNYLEMFTNAKLAFLHHIVYDPISFKRICLNTPEVCYKFLGSLDNVPFIFDQFNFKRHFVPHTRDSMLDTCESIYPRSELEESLGL